MYNICFLDLHRPDVLGHQPAGQPEVPEPELQPVHGPRPAGPLRRDPGPGVGPAPPRPLLQAPQADQPARLQRDPALGARGGARRPQSHPRGRQKPELPAVAPGQRRPPLRRLPAGAAGRRICRHAHLPAQTQGPQDGGGRTGGAVLCAGAAQPAAAAAGAAGSRGLVRVASHARHDGLPGAVLPQSPGTSLVRISLLLIEFCGVIK
jgi:hypothetical protein